MNIYRVPELKRTIAEIVDPIYKDSFPVQIEFSQGMEFPLYRITVHKVESDVFVDSKGQKWKRILE